MKKILIAGCSLLLLTSIKAQQKEGRIIYERTVQLQIQLAGAGDGMEHMLPRSRTDKFELTFGNDQTLWRQAEPDNADEGGSFNSEGGMQIRMVAAGSNDVLYTNLDTKKRVEYREMFDKKFIVDDSIQTLKWKMTGETKNILNHNCMKATAERISQRLQMNMENGKMERKEVTDTSLVVAWFAMDIPVSSGPAEFQGQLPGMILEMDIANGRQVFKAIAVEQKADLTIIKEPSGKKHYTAAEFRKEREKMLEEMQRNNTGGNRVIRVN